ncbi:hypothetical protein [Streptodolium elevatio]|uniref:Head-to-tail adaptor n=1 Tax=Streptodolium elevatio TaxID=3157996 RepID=A0ABV3DBV4_9ACTN
MADFATLDELKARLHWTLDSDEERIATAALEDASDLARHYARREWPDPTKAPRLVRTLVLKACRRHMTNPDGYTQSRAGDESLAWSDEAAEDAGSVEFTAEERNLLAALGGKQTGFTSVAVSAWNSVQRPVAVGLVPVAQPTPDAKPFPYYADPEEPW